MSESISPRQARRLSVRAVVAFLALIALVVVGTLELRANRAAGAAVRAIEARMAGTGDGDGDTLPTRAEVERLIDRRAAATPTIAADGSLAVVYHWAGVFRSYEVRAYYSPGAVPRLVRYETPGAGTPAARD